MKQPKRTLGRTALFIAAAIALCSCSSGKNEDAAGAGGEATAASPGKEAVNAPLKAELVNIDVKVTKGPSYDAATDQLRVTVALTNNGPVVLPVTGRNPVTMGVVQKVASDNGLPDKRGEETRAAFTEDIAPTQTGLVEVTLPAAFAVGHKVEFDALQESVAWFGFTYDQDTAVVGPFRRCDGDVGLCGSDGTPLPTL